MFRRLERQNGHNEDTMGYNLRDIRLRPAYWPDENLWLDIEVEVTYEGRAGSRPTWDDPGDPGDPVEFRVLSVECGGIRCDFLAREIERDLDGEIGARLADRLADDRCYEPDDYDYEPDPGPWSIHDLRAGRW